jgi:hypothetical protein
MFLAFLREQEERWGRQEKTRTWRNKLQEHKIKDTMRNCSFLNWMEYCSKKLEPTEMCFGVLIHTKYENLWSKRIMTFSTTKYENVHGVRIQCKIWIYLWRRLNTFNTNTWKHAWSFNTCKNMDNFWIITNVSTPTHLTSGAREQTWQIEEGLCHTMALPFT